MAIDLNDMASSYIAKNLPYHMVYVATITLLQILLSTISISLTMLVALSCPDNQEQYLFKIKQHTPLHAYHFIYKPLFLSQNSLNYLCIYHLWLKELIKQLTYQLTIQVYLKGNWNVATESTP